MVKKFEENLLLKNLGVTIYCSVREAKSVRTHEHQQKKVHDGSVRDVKVYLNEI